jgi:hypothetical protein
MKITQTDNQIVIKQGGVTQLIGGITFIVIGIGLAIAIGGGLVKSSNGQKPSPLIALFGVVFAVIGVLVFLTAKNRTIVIEKGGNTTVDAKKLIGGKDVNQSFPTTSIIAVRLNTYMDSTSSTGMNNSGVSFGNNNNSQRRSTLSLLLNNNDMVELGSSGSSGSGLNINGMNVGSLISKAPLSKEAGQISTFLGVPLQADDNSSIAGAIHSAVDMFKQAKNGQPTSFNQNAPTSAQPSLTPTQSPQPAQTPQTPQPPVAPGTPTPPPASQQ